MRIRVRERLAHEPALAPARAEASPARSPARVEARPAPRAGQAVRGLALLGSPLLLFGLLAGVVPAFARMLEEVGAHVPELSEQVFALGAWAASPAGLVTFLLAYGLLVLGRRRAWLATAVFFACVAATAAVALALLLPLEPLDHI